jgi:hypothetical protein
VLPVKPEDVASKWRLQPGKIFLVDMKQGRIVDDREIKAELVDKRPWRKWLDEHLINLDDLPGARATSSSRPRHAARAAARVRVHERGHQAADDADGGRRHGGAGLDGHDTPLACLSDKPQLLYNYFRSSSRR